MNTLRIGILDSEMSYVAKLSSYLNKFGRESFNVSGFTDEEQLRIYMSERGIDLLAATDRNVLIQLQQRFPQTGYAWLADEKGCKNITMDNSKIYSVYRYQSAKVIGEYIKDIVECLGLLRKSEKRIAAIYSPIGRCGKTSLAVKLARESQYGGWLYIGMEDYSFRMDEQGGASEDFLYFVKEREEKAVRGILQETPSVIPSPFSPFDTRLINREDVEWFIRLFEDELSYSGAIFDIGTGVLEGLDVLLMFDNIIVPYLSDRYSMEKRNQFEDLVKAYEIDELLDKVHYIDMGDGEDKMKELQVLLQ